MEELGINFRLGYACINTVLRAEHIFSSRTARLATVKEHGVGWLQDLAIKNLQDALRILEWNEAHGLRFMRLSSEIFAHFGNVDGYDSMDFAKAELEALGEYARTHGHRLTAHPGQFTQLGTPRPDVLTRSKADLTAQARMFELMGLTPEMGSVMIIHGGGTFGDKAATLARWEEAFLSLPAAVRQYIVLENDERQYFVTDLLPMCERLGIPLVVDFFHHECSQKLGLVDFELDAPLLARVVAIWTARGIKPKCHLSEQAPGTGVRIGTHADDIAKIPPAVQRWALTAGVDIMLESKNKEQTTLKLYRKYFTLFRYKGRFYWRFGKPKAAAKK